MVRLIIEQPLDAHKPHGGDYDHCHSDRDKRSPVVTAERPQQSFELYPGSRIGRALVVAIASTDKLNFSMTNPNPNTALPVHAQARNVRSLAA
jgi:hypothetical protein